MLRNCQHINRQAGSRINSKFQEERGAAKRAALQPAVHPAVQSSDAALPKPSALEPRLATTKTKKGTRAFAGTTEKLKSLKNVRLAETLKSVRLAETQ